MFDRNTGPERPLASRKWRGFDTASEIPYAIEMCLICLEFEKGKLTTAEARRALGEMVPQLEPEHVREVESLLAEAEAQDDGTK